MSVEMMKMRQDFEAWYEAMQMPAESDWFKRDPDEPDEYDSVTTEHAWRAWQEAERQAMERAEAAIVALRDSHCADTQNSPDPEFACTSDGADCDFVAAWNDAINIIRALADVAGEKGALYGEAVDQKALLTAARAVAFSNGFDAGLPGKMEALREAVLVAMGDKSVRSPPIPTNPTPIEQVPHPHSRGWMGETGGFPDDSDRYPEDALIVIEKMGFALEQARKALTCGDRNDAALAVMEIDAVWAYSGIRQSKGRR